MQQIRYNYVRLPRVFFGIVSLVEQNAKGLVQEDIGEVGASR